MKKQCLTIVAVLCILLSCIALPTTAAKPENLILNKRPTASGKVYDYNLDNPDPYKNGTHLTDGNRDDSHWAAIWGKDNSQTYTPGTMYENETIFTWNLGGKYDLTSYTVVPKAEHYSWRLEVSSDGKKWETAHEVADGTWIENNSFKKQNVTHARLIFTNIQACAKNELILSIKEVELYGVPAGQGSNEPQGTTTGGGGGATTPTTTQNQGGGSTGATVTKGNILLNRLPSFSGADAFDFADGGADPIKNGTYLTDGDKEKKMILWQKGNYSDKAAIESIFTWDLGDKYNLKSYTLIPDAQGYGWLFQVSADGNNWETVDTVTSSEWKAEKTFKKNGIRYIRVHFNKTGKYTSSERYLVIQEIDVQGTLASADNGSAVEDTTAPTTGTTGGNNGDNATVGTQPTQPTGDTVTTAPNQQTVILPRPAGGLPVWVIVIMIVGILVLAGSTCAFVWVYKDSKKTTAKPDKEPAEHTEPEE